MMARMIGHAAWWRMRCSCCNRPRTHGQQRQIEKRQWLREVRESC
jgi:hypothetical protein